MLDVAMAVAAQAGAGEARPVDEGGVVEAVFEDGVAAPGEGAHHPQVGHVAGGEEQRPRLPHEFGQGRFQTLVVTGVAAQEVGGAGPHARLLGGAHEGGPHLGVVGQAQVVVAGEGEETATVHHHLRSRGAVTQTRSAVAALGAQGREARGQRPEGVVHAWAAARRRCWVSPRTWRRRSRSICRSSSTARPGVVR